MSEPLITECPGCHSRFRVTEGQLDIANGQVRCGACLRVFDARNEAHRLELRRRQAQQRTTAAPAGNSPDLGSRDSDYPPTPQTTTTATGIATGTESSAAPPAPADTTERGTDRIATDVRPTADEATPRPSSQADAATDDSSTTPSRQPTARPRSDSADDGIPHLYAEPILLDVSRESSDPVATAGWALGCLTALLLLGLQYAWFERGTLARDPDLAPLYTLACETLPCALSRNAIDQIVNERMVVRPHPAFADALSIDLRLHNRAAFAQPFPALQLSFSDLHGNLVARRTFQPDDYLTNRQLDQAQMPPGTPVEVRLEITDPGARALSYSLTLKPAR
jgi:predicted Zn finger-like uncharacterized protein